MKTERLYYEYTSAEPFNAEIIEILPEERGLILDRTIFYPEGGGQIGDRGSINNIPLEDTIEKDGEILHIIAEGYELPAKGSAELTLDARRRLDFTVHHTAQHLLSASLLSIASANTLSMHLGEGICTIDLDVPTLKAGAIIAAEELCQEAIEEDARTIIHLCPPESLADFPLRKAPPESEEPIRVVEIKGHDFSACCGTHLPSAGRIGALRILGVEKYKGGVRVSFLAGRRLLAYSRGLGENIDMISQALKVPLMETGRGTLELLERMKNLERRLKDLEDRDARHQAEALVRRGNLPGIEAQIKSPPVYRELFQDAPMEELLRIGRAAQKLTGAALALGSKRDLKFAVLSSAPGIDLRSYCKAPMEALGGRGGGSAAFFQGQFDSPETLAEFLKGLPETF